MFKMYSFLLIQAVLVPAGAAIPTFLRHDLLDVGQLPWDPQQDPVHVLNLLLQNNSHP